MKKFYSLVLMAAALLVSTTASAATVAKIGTTEYATFEAAWKAAQNNDEILLTANVEIGKILWLGTTTMGDENPLSITLNLGGDTLFSTATKVFVITHGSLTVKNGVIKHNPAGPLKNSSEYYSAYEVFRVLGSTYKDVDSKTAAEENLYSHLTIEASARIIAAANGVVVDQFSAFASTSHPAYNFADAWAAGNKALPSTDAAKAALYTDVYKAGNGVAHGVRIDVKGYIEAKKYAIKANGSMRTPDFSGNTSKIGQESYRATQYSDRNNTRYVVAAEDAKNYSPYIHVYSGATLLTTETARTDAVAAYSGGYARWLVEGNVTGSTAVYVKSGEIDIKSANITSNFNGTASGSTADRGSGVDAGGSGLVIESSANYAGSTDVTIEGSTVITPTSGFALEEKITDVADTSKVDNVDIKGGTFKEGGAGTITVTTQTTTGNGTSNTTVTIDGGTFEFADNTSGTNTGVDLGGKSLEEFLVAQATTSETTHTVVVDTDEFGHQTIVISDGNAPSEVEGNSVIGAAEGAAISWKNSSVTEETLVADLKLTELQISQDYVQRLIIPDGLKLEVGRVVLGAKAQIVVEAGGKLIVTGKQGLAAFQESNLILKNENGKRSIFLFEPSVSSNTHPMAKVELITNSWRNSSTDLQWEILGLPTYEAATSIDKEGTAPVAISVWENGAWSSLGIVGSTAIDLSKLDKSFAPYDLLANRKSNEAAPKLVIGGKLIGNIDGALNATHKWTPFANSYTAEMDLKAFLTSLGGAQSIAQGIWVAEQQGGGHLAWNAVDLQEVLDGDADILKLAPMQAFMLNNPGSSVEAAEIDYETAIYAPAVPGYVPAGAPRRITASETTAKVRVIVANEQGIVDKVMLRENADNVYALEKYMNEDMNIYVLAGEKNAIVNAENMADTYVGFSTVKGGEFTISFANIAGREFDIIDLENGARINVVEGSQYTFLTPANYTNDYRFKVVEREEVATDIENTEAVKSATGIYTITGQFMGEMNVWNSLPAGVYVVNGEKRVK